MTESRWTLTIRCPRPANRAADDFHVQPEKVDRLAHEWFGRDAAITLTARTATLQIRGEGQMPGHLIDHYRTSFASALSCLFLKIELKGGGGYVLPRPVRTDIREEQR
ncbi:hypothetical protein MUK60_07395 [Streptomyces sp. LRE541]|uniref:hypothetical protein n=1 Tax=Streptomyces sp. LRE541 TaxID=2931983 RepID=UPI00200F29F3|nr:hypothetical protein [Streptomyces sp. LRE541]UPZ27657.1 hypothetical protein MUK60_07395 [Streptomyces sp. LRE541]